MRKGLIAGILIAVIAIGGFFLGKGAPSNKAVPSLANGQGYQEKTIPVETIEAARGEVIQEATLNVTYTANSSVPVMAKVAGTIDKVLVKVGDQVTKGQTLFVIEDRQYRLQAQQAEAAYEAAKANLAQLEKGASQEELEQAEAAVAQAEASLAGARKGLENAEKMLADRTQFKQSLQGAQTQAELAKSQVEAAKTGVTQAEIAYQNAEDEYLRMQELYAKEMVSRQQLDAVKLQYESAKAGYEASVERLRQAEIGLAAAADALKLAQQSYDDPRSMVAQVDAAKMQLAMAEAGYQAAVARLDMVKKGASQEQLAAVRAQVKQAKTALELAQLQLEYTQVSAPISGQVAQLSAETGAMAAPGSPAGVVADVSTMKAKVVVPETYINKLALGQMVNLTATALPNTTFVGQISAISPMADVQTRQFPVEISIGNRTGQLKAGMFGTVSLITGKAVDAVMLPVSVVLYDRGESYVYTVVDGRAVRQSVELGLTEDEHVVVSKGLAEGAVVISNGQHQVKNGSLVEVK